MGGSPCGARRDTRPRNTMEITADEANDSSQPKWAAFGAIGPEWLLLPNVAAQVLLGVLDSGRHPKSARLEQAAGHACGRGFTALVGTRDVFGLTRFDGVGVRGLVG